MSLDYSGFKDLYVCDKCGEKLELIDVIDRDGGIEKGTLTEIQVWSCPNGDHGYWTIDVRGEITDTDV